MAWLMPESRKASAAQHLTDVAVKRRRGRPAKVERESEDADRSGNMIRAMVVGLTVLRTVGQSRRPQSLREIASASGMMPSRVQRYLSSLLAAGYVRQDPQSGGYALGETTAEIGLLALGQIDAIEIGTEALEAYSDQSGRDGHLSVWGSHGPTVVRWRSGGNGLQFRVEEGRVLPILTTATGRLLAAFRDPDDVAPMIEPELESWNRNHPDQPLDRDRLEAVFAGIRRNEWASMFMSAGGSPVEIGTSTSDAYALNAMVVPIFDHLGEARMALTFFGSEQIGRADAVERTEPLAEVGRIASRKLGFAGGAAFSS